VSSSQNNNKKRNCRICGDFFLPDSNRQRVCSKQDCVIKYKQEYHTRWRKDNPEYYKGSVSEVRRKQMKRWREENPDYYKIYREKNRESYNQYMRDYMRTYRERLINPEM
jgi:hypothetical protein